MSKKRRSARPVRVPRTRRVDVTRDEFDRLSAVVTELSAALASMRHELQIQFTRMAQIQIQLEQVQRRVQQIADGLKS